MTLTRETLEVLQGGTMGTWRVALYQGRTINGAAVVNADGLRIGTLSLKADKPLDQKRGDARKIALVNQMADVCVKAAELQRVTHGGKRIGEMTPDERVQSVGDRMRAWAALESALTALEEARRAQSV